MPRPTDVVFRNFKELTFIPREDIIPPLPQTPTYPTKLLVNLVDESPEGSYEYWLLESGKTLRTLRPASRPRRPRPTPLQHRDTPPQTPQKPKPNSPSTSGYKSKKKPMKPLSPIKIFRSRSRSESKSKSPSKSIPTTPLSPCQSFCYPPLNSPTSPLSARLKFWKRHSPKAMEEEQSLQAGFESGLLEGEISPGAEFERRMWKIERDERRSRSRSNSASTSASNKPRSWRPSELLIDSEDEAGVFESDVDEDNSTGDQPNFSIIQSCKSTASLFSSPKSSRYGHSRSRSSTSTLPPIKEITEPTNPVEPKPKPYRSLLPPPADPYLHDLEIAFYQIRKHRKNKTKNASQDNDDDQPIQCPIFKYQGTPMKWDQNPFVLLYFYIPFYAPWVLVELLRLSFCWIPYFSSSINYIIENGGGTFLFLLSNLAFAAAALPVMFLIPLLSWPVCVVHDYFLVRVFRRMPFYRFKYSLGFPGFVEDVGERT